MVIKKKLPKCKECGDRFTPYYGNMNQKYCMKKDECIKAFSDKQKEITEKKEKKDWKERKSAIKRSIETRGDVAKTLETPINKIVRLIDSGGPCMMCGNPNMKRINACHYHSVGSNETLRFNLLNIFHGCHKCNSELGGNHVGYDEKLIEVFGREFWEYVKFDMVRETKDIHLTREELRNYAKEARKIVRELEKLELKNLSPKLRIKFRKEYNKRLGIYTNIL